MIRSNNITYKGKGYPIKFFNGYYFSTDELFNAMRDPEGEEWDTYDDEETWSVDSRIAYFFDEESFHSMTAEELYKEYDLHS